MDKVEIVEVGPRDGLQNISQFIPTQAKIELIRKLIAAGFKRLEVGSFVSPKAVPQMSDIEAVLAGLGPTPGVRKAALVPNVKGAQRAVAAGIKEIQYVISMSEAHNANNVRRPIAASIEDFRRLLAEVDPDRKLKIRVGLATVFHCPFEGLMDEDWVLEIAHSIVSLRDGMELGLGDTTGMAAPDQVKRLCGRMIREFEGVASVCFHAHDTAGFGIASVLAALDAGVRSFDAAVSGLGGCPFAPGATGNVATEDVVYTFSRMGVQTGIDLAKLLDAAEFAATLPGAVRTGHIGTIPRERILPHASNVHHPVRAEALA